jgi:hypothetical protein
MSRFALLGVVALLTALVAAPAQGAITSEDAYLQGYAAAILEREFRAGIQLDGVLATRSLQLLLEYFSGYSPNGQFYRDKIDYLGLGLHFHF